MFSLFCQYKRENIDIFIYFHVFDLFINKKIRISLHKWLLLIYENAEIYNTKLARLEPSKFGLDYTKNEALNELRLSWLGDRDSNPDTQDQNLVSYH